MERGTIVSYDCHSGFGSISRSGNPDVKFNANAIIGRDRLSLKQGDMVWFEVENIQNSHMAINIRKS